MAKALPGFIKAKSKLSKKHLAVYVIIFALVGGTILWLSFAAPNPNLPSDLNNDNTVNAADLTSLLSAYGTSSSAADINGDGRVNAIDLSIMLSNFNRSVLSYDATILSDNPVGYWTLSEGSGSAKDKSSNNISGTYYGSTAKTTLPNSEGATVFNGTSNTYAEIPDTDNYSITTTKKLTWEAWIRPDNLNFVNSTRGYINWMGKCHVLSPTCEWMARFYNLVNTQNRCNRFSAYAFNPTASFGSGAYWQPTCGLIVQSHWMHVVGEYQTITTPSVCDATYPGTIDIWVNGVKWDQSYAGITGCMSQYSIIPVNNDSPIDIGTVSKDSWYEGAVGKVAIYNYLLSQSQITSHYKTMTGTDPSGICTATCTLTNP